MDLTLLMALAGIRHGVMMIEIALPSFTAVWFGLGAVLVGMLVWLLPSLSVSWQVFILAVSSATAAFYWYRYF